MADATPPTTPAAEVAHVNPNGTVDTGDRPAFVWCQDEGTGGRFDMHSRALPRKGVRVIEGYPLNFKRQARLSKSRLELAGDPAEGDVHGNVAEPSAPESTDTGDEAHAALAAATGPVETRAPEVAPSGDAVQKQAAADSTASRRR